MEIMHASGHAPSDLSAAASLAQAIESERIGAMTCGLAAVREPGDRLFILKVGGGAGHASHAVNDFHTRLPGLRASGGAVVTFSSSGATAPPPRFDAYAASKAARARLTENMASELTDVGVRVNRVAPGFVATDVDRGTLAAGRALVGADYFERTLSELEQGGVPANEAAELIFMLLEDNPDPPFTGKLISARWDPWRDVSFQRELAEQRELATLRRIDDMLFTSVSGDDA